MAKTDFQKIRNAIEQAVNLGKTNFIIYPYGEYGCLTKRILNDCFGIKESFIIDNNLSKFNPNIKNLDYFKNLSGFQYIVLFTCANPDIYKAARNNLDEYFPDENIIEIFVNAEGNKCLSIQGTQCGKYSYGPLCDHELVESVGAFCSFAMGSDVVPNHPVRYISTHPFMVWDDSKNERGYFSGIQPKGGDYKLEKIKIGNDVWLGRNVLITNSSYIGNGVIAGAGAVITKSVPDYAVVVGVPARIIRYRYTKEEIAALNRIAWWDWPDDKIRENYDDFFLGITKFISKHDKF